MYIMRVCLYILLIKVPLRYTLIAYDCFHERSNVTTVSLKEVGPCIYLDNRDIKTEIIDGQIIQDKSYEMLHIQHCKVTILKTISHCGMHHHASVVSGGFSSYLSEISKLQCKSLHQLEHLVIEGIKTVIPRHNNSVDHVMTIVGTTDNYGNCKGGNYIYLSTNYQNVVVTISLSVELKDYYTPLDIKGNIISFNDGTSCKKDDEKCIHPVYGYTIWNVANLLTCRRHYKDVIYQGLMNVTSRTGKIIPGSVISINKGNQVFKIIAQRSTDICDQSAYETDESSIFIVPKYMNEYYFIKSGINPRNLDLIMHLNYKIAYVFDLLNEKLDMVYKTLTKQNCEIERLTIKNKLILARNHPYSYGNIITDDLGYMSVIAGEVMHITQCQMVEVSLRRTTRCYNNLPIQYNNVSLFVEPFTRTLTNTSDEVVCSPITPILYQLTNDWYSLTPNTLKVLPPHIIQPTTNPSSLNYTNVNELINSGIYDNNALDSYKTFLQFPMVKIEASGYIAAKGSGIRLYDDHSMNNNMILDIASLKAQAMHAISEFFGWTKTFGSYMGALLGIGMIYKLITKACSTMLNGATLYQAFGCGFHLLASFMTSLTHLVFNKKIMKTNSDHTRKKDVEEQDEDIPMVYSSIHHCNTNVVHPTEGTSNYKHHKNNTYPNIMMEE